MACWWPKGWCWEWAGGRWSRQKATNATHTTGRVSLWSVLLRAALPWGVGKTWKDEGRLFLNLHSCQKKSRALAVQCLFSLAILSRSQENEWVGLPPTYSCLLHVLVKVKTKLQRSGVGKLACEHSTGDSKGLETGGLIVWRRGLCPADCQTCSGELSRSPARSSVSEVCYCTARCGSAPRLLPFKGIVWPTAHFHNNIPVWLKSKSRPSFQKLSTTYSNIALSSPCLLFCDLCCFECFQK